MEQITLDMIPNSHTPTAHISQYDSGRHIRFNLQNITLTGSETATLKIRKTDGELVSKIIENHTSYVEYVSEKADCDVSGKTNSEIVISKDDVVIGSKNFILNVEADPYDNAGVVTETASGAIATFETNMADVLQEVKCEINASGGNGTPDNPNPINGYTEANITACGVNLWDEEWELGVYGWTGLKSPDNTKIRSKNFIPCTPETTMYISTPKSIQIFYYDTNKTIIRYEPNSVKNTTITTPANCAYITFFVYDASYGTTYNNDISINYPATDTTYHAYNGQTYTIAFGQTVYGGVLDVTRGKIHVTHGKYLLDGNTSRNDLGLTLLSNITQISYVPFISEGKGVSVFLSNIFQDSTNQGLYKIWNNRNSQQPVPRMFLGLPNTVTTIEQAIAWFASNPTEVIYELATPIDIDLTPQQIEALLGVNNVWHDGNGNTEVKYLYNA